MIVGVGVDLVRIDRIGRLLDRYGERFGRKVFTPTEWTESGGRASHLAGRFAVKEAVLKALGTGLSGGIAWHDVETLSRESGAPEVRTSGIVRSLLERKGPVFIWASISHERENAVAMVILEGGDRCAS
jgi:holo-[acyl-carrier protein] synthase